MFHNSKNRQVGSIARQCVFLLGEQFTPAILIFTASSLVFTECFSWRKKLLLPLFHQSSQKYY